MTKSQKNSVDEMLAVGISIPKIAAFLHVSQNSIKSYLQRKHPNDVCLNCGTPVLQVPHRKQKKFCCDACRMHYWKRSHDSLCVLRKAGSQLPKSSKKILLPCLCCERKVSMTKEIEIYKVSLAVLRNFLKSGLLTQLEYVQCEQTLAEKCGLSLGSIFRESA